MEIVIKTILRQIINQCAGTQDIIMWSMWKKKWIKNGCVSFAFKYISFHLYTVTSLKWSINELISVIILRERSQISVLIFTSLQESYLGTYVTMVKFTIDTQSAAVLTYLCTMWFLLRASDWSSNVQHRKWRSLPFTRNCPVTSLPGCEVLI